MQQVFLKYTNDVNDRWRKFENSNESVISNIQKIVNVMSVKHIQPSHDSNCSCNLMSN